MCEVETITAALANLASFLGTEAEPRTVEQRFHGMVDARGEVCFAQAWLGQTYEEVRDTWDEWSSDIDDLLDTYNESGR